MIRSVLITCLVLTAPLAQADEAEPNLMRKGLELFFQGLQTELAPAMDDLAQLLADLGPGLENMVIEMGPALADVLNSVEDWSAYEVPEVLPNGDIIIRRKAPMTAPNDQTDL